MKPAPFDYVAARSVEEALAALREDGARVLAGGQSLLPLLNARRERAARLVDINGAGLGVIRRTDGRLHLGATVRQAALVRSALVAEHWPLLAQAVRHVGHIATRTRGTVGGSVAHADPRAQLPLALLALDAEPVEKGPLLLELVVPPLPPGTRTAFAEHSRTFGDFPAAAAAVAVGPGHAAVAVLGAGRSAAAEHALRQGAGAREAAELAAAPRSAAAEHALRQGAGAREAAELAAAPVEGEHGRALAAEVTRRALVECGR